MAIEWNVKNAISRDVERQHLNKILADIRASINSIPKASSATTGGVKDQVGEMVVGNTESGISVTYDNSAKVLNFAVSGFLLTLAGDVSGSATITPGGSATIEVTIDPDKIGLTDTTNDGRAYWRRYGTWEAVGYNLEALRTISGDGFPAANYDPSTEISEWNMRTITGTADRISVTDGDGAAGNPVIDLVDEGVQDIIAAALVAGANITITHDDVAGTITIASTASGTGGGEILVTGAAGPIALSTEDESDWLYTG